LEFTQGNVVTEFGLASRFLAAQFFFPITYIEKFPAKMHALVVLAIMTSGEFRYIRRSPLSSADDIAESPELFSHPVEWLEKFIPSKFFQIPKYYKLNGHPKYINGRVIGMDAASVAPVWALKLWELEEAESPTVLDMCCAPGMKFMTIQDSLVSFKINNVRLVGTDVSDNRLRVCRNLLKKYGYTDPLLKWLYFKKIGEVVEFVPFESHVAETSIRKQKSKKKKQRLTNDDRIVIPKPPAQYDRILVDAECTHDGSERHVSKHVGEDGFWAKNSSKPHRIFYDNDEKISRLIITQKELIVNGFEQLRPGGLLVYSTCSLQPEQNEGVVEYLLKKFPEHADLEDLPFGLIGDEESVTVPARRVFGKCCLFDPAVSPTSGQFVAAIRKKKFRD